MKKSFDTSRGFPLPYGPSLHERGVNFALFSKHATGVTLCLFDDKQNNCVAEIPLDPLKNKTGNVWHIFVYGLAKKSRYGYKVDGPYDPFKGHCFNPRSILIDPYTKLLTVNKDKQRGHVYPFESFDWGNDCHPKIALKELIIYEMHVGGFTKDPSSKVKWGGSFLGMIEKIDYLKKLGVNAVEFLPLQEFNKHSNPYTHPTTKEPLKNFWGYSTTNYFSLAQHYTSGTMNPLNEFKLLVKELHKNGIEVILDVVYNHTAEGNQKGPTLSFKGLENSVYYMLAPNGEYYNFSGCGNTVNCNHPIVREFIRDTLRYWVLEMHVDGFRFDLASILVRSHDGIPLKNPPLIEAITKDPILAHTKFIAEAWDAGGLYQVGSFPSWGVWAEWNGKYRDSVRSFIKGTDGEIGEFATRLCGSEDLYGKGRSPYHSINFITAHDGFTLKDLVSYNEKHNEENGENNQDGTHQNNSWNCGFEGETSNKKVVHLRRKQMRNFHLALFVSQGVPMFYMGDEYGHTKKGNNNSWGHDSQINWFRWDILKENENFFHFTAKLIAFRKAHPILSRSNFLKKEDITWHGKEPFHPNWGEKSRFIAFTLTDSIRDIALYIAFNAHFESVEITLPPIAEGAHYYRIVDTSKTPPADFINEKNAKPMANPKYKLPPNSSILLKVK